MALRNPVLAVLRHEAAAAVSRRSAASFLRQTQRRGYADNNSPNERPDFKGQLWESTTQRVQREKEEQARFASQRSLGGGSSGLAFTAGIYTHTPASFNCIKVSD